MKDAHVIKERAEQLLAKATISEPEARQMIMSLLALVSKPREYRRGVSDNEIQEAMAKGAQAVRALLATAWQTTRERQ